MRDKTQKIQRRAMRRARQVERDNARAYAKLEIGSVGTLRGISAPRPVAYVVRSSDGSMVGIVREGYRVAE